MSVSSSQSVPVSVSAQNVELIQQLSKPDQNEQIVVLNKDTGSLEIQSEKTSDVAWVVFVSLDRGAIKKREIVEVVSDAALKALGSTLEALEEKEAHSEFEQRRMKHLEKQAQGSSAAAASASASAVAEQYLVIPAQNALLTLFLESAIGTLSEDVAPKAAADLSETEELDQSIVNDVVTIILAYNELQKTSPEGAKRFVQEIMRFAMANKVACQATVARTGRNLYIKAFNAERYGIEGSSDADKDVYNYLFVTEHKEPLKAYHWCHRAVQYNSDGSIYMHLTKKMNIKKPKHQNPYQPLGKDLRVGRGTSKEVSLALRIDKIGEILASAGSLEPLINESCRLTKFKDVEGVLKYYHGVTYIAYDPNNPELFVKKYRMLTNYCNHGTLRQAIEQKTLSDVDKASCAKQLVEILTPIHDRKWIHRDLKPQNIFLHRTEEGVLKVTLGDFGGAFRSDDPQSSKGRAFSTTPYFAPPELIAVLHRHKHFDMRGVPSVPMQLEVLGTNTPGLDLWGLACILWLLYEPKTLPWLEVYNASFAEKKDTELQRMEKMITLMKESRLQPLPFDDNNKRHSIIRRLMDIVPGNRLSLRGLKAQLDDLKDIKKEQAPAEAQVSSGAQASSSLSASSGNV